MRTVFWSEKPIERLLLVCMGIALLGVIAIKAGVLAYFITG